jgi:NAD(P) transhydrogenase subunit alpha
MPRMRQPDAAYEAKGCRIVSDRASFFAEADIVFQIRMAAAAGKAADADLHLVRAGELVIGLSEPLISANSAKTLADRGVTAFSMELIPRITRAHFRTSRKPGMLTTCGSRGP